MAAPHSKNTKNTKNAKNTDGTKNTDSTKDTKSTNSTKDTKNTKSTKDAKDTTNTTDALDAKDTNTAKGAKDTSNTKRTKNTSETKESKSRKVARETKGTTAAKDTKPSGSAAPAAVATPNPSPELDGPAQPLKAPRTRKAPQAAKPPEGLRILMVASEAKPFSKTGGLADVTTSLSNALGRMGHEVTLVTPRYRGAPGGEARDTVRAFVGDRSFEAQLLEVPIGEGANALLVDCPPLYDRAGVYTEGNRDYPDNATRFAFLSIAALEWAAAQPAAPSLIHVHDWQTGLAPVYARTVFPRLDRVPFVLTIHNLAYQGIFDKSWVPRLGLSWQGFTVSGFEFWDRLSFLKGGITFSDALTTVSPTYAHEIQRPEYGYGLDGVIQSRRDVLTGILNGIDTEEWNPAGDPYLPASYDATDLSGKREVKRALLDAFGLPADDAAMGRPVVGMVSRLVEQKGLDLIAAVARQLPSLHATFTVVGTGDARYEQMWRSLAAAYPDRIGAFIGFDERRAHLVEGGADIFLMPSRFEPCGLNQLYSLRYGTVPVVRAVGGLVDTVRPYNQRNGQGTGFLFSDYDPADLLDALNRALEAYRQPAAWRRLQMNGMSDDFSWDRSAAEYVKVYRRVMGARQET